MDYERAAVHQNEDATMSTAVLDLRSDSGIDRTESQRANRSVVQKILAVLAWVYVACLTVQVLLAGLGVFVSPIWFQRHKAFVHGFGWLDFVLLILAFAAGSPRRIKRLVVTLVVLVGMQYSTILLRGPLHTVLIGAFHPVSAVLLYATALALARGAWTLAWPRRATRAGAHGT